MSQSAAAYAWGIVVLDSVNLLAITLRMLLAGISVNVPWKKSHYYTLNIKRANIHSLCWNKIPNTDALSLVAPVHFKLHQWGSESSTFQLQKVTWLRSVSVLVYSTEFGLNQQVVQNKDSFTLQYRINPKINSCRRLQKNMSKYSGFSSQPGHVSTLLHLPDLTYCSDYAWFPTDYNTYFLSELLLFQFSE